jgi:hypothetical protein
MPMPPPVPGWIREFAYPGWTNVFQLVPDAESIYPKALRPEWKDQFNSQGGRYLGMKREEKELVTR